MEKIPAGMRMVLTGRRHVVIASAVGAVASLLALTVMLLASADFVSRLAVWFFFCLFGFHWYFATKHRLTQTEVRLIDYVYLGVATVGVFILTLNYGEKRAAYTTARDLAAIRTDLTTLHTKLAHIAIAIEAEACRPPVQRVLSSYCEPAKQLKIDLGGEFSAEQAKAAVDRYVRAAIPPLPSDDEKMVAYRSLGRLTDELKSAERSLTIHTLFLELQSPLPPADPLEEELYGLFTWPFILALALALRITKTTIEVLEWTTPPPTPDIVQSVEESLPEIGPSPPTWISRERG